MTFPSDPESLGARDARDGNAEIDMKASSHAVSDDDVDLALLGDYNKEKSPDVAIPELSETEAKVADPIDARDETLIALEVDAVRAATPDASVTPGEQAESMDVDHDIQKEATTSALEVELRVEEKNDDKEEPSVANGMKKVMAIAEDSEMDDDAEFHDANSNENVIANDMDKKEAADDGEKATNAKKKENDSEHSEFEAEAEPDEDESDDGQRDKDDASRRSHRLLSRDSKSPSTISRKPRSVPRSSKYVSDSDRDDMDNFNKNRHNDNTDDDSDASDSPVPSKRRASTTTSRRKRGSTSSPAKNVRTYKRRRAGSTDNARGKQKQKSPVRVEISDHDDDDDDDDTDKFEVEGIIQHRMYRGHVTRYLVKWKGYDAEESTWEPAKVLQEDSPDVVTKYWDTLPKDEPRPRNLPVATLDRSSPVPAATVDDDDDDDDDFDMNVRKTSKSDKHFDPDEYGDDDDNDQFAVGGSYTARNTFYNLAKTNRISHKDLITSTLMRLKRSCPASVAGPCWPTSTGTLASRLSI
ncbi:hypothetical protein BC940DRAFT_90216 [Gongronella butleri]|nr:hypothetical protein BC940DRAFT_90216 [Gongronella butleri]